MNDIIAAHNLGNTADPTVTDTTQAISYTISARAKQMQQSGNPPIVDYLCSGFAQLPP